MDIKQYFAKNLRGVKVMSQIGYGDLIFFDNPDQLELIERQTKLWKASGGILKRVDCVLYSVKIDGQFFAEYETKEHAIGEIKKLADCARKGDEQLTGLKCFKFSHECELKNRERLAAKGIKNPQARRK